jgi:tetratricopeptide (TPR) repeat protein
VRAVLVTLTLAACSTRTSPSPSASPSPDQSTSTSSTTLRLPLAVGIGHHHRDTSCPPGAAPWFDEGLALYYAFDLEGAERAFRRAGEGNDCAIARWGVALSLGVNLNVPSMPDRRKAARAAVAQAQGGGSLVERGLIEALRVRYDGDDAGAGDKAYANAMRALHKQFPDDPDVAALFAESLLDLRPFAQWSPKGEPAPETPELVETLETLLERHVQHPGLNHYYVHAMESSPHPDKALDAARRLEALMPAAGHIVHMPSHIYLRTGRYAQAAEANRKALAADERWSEQGRVGPLYAMYPLHDHHFLWLALLHLGRAEEAKKEAKQLVDACTPEMMRAMPGMEPLLATPILTAVRFAEWERLLTLSESFASNEWPLADGLWHFGRARAYAALGKADQARKELDAIDQLFITVREDRRMGANTTLDVLHVAAAVARGDLASRMGDPIAAERTLREAVAREDALLYDEPPSWPLPAREVLGRVLLDHKKWQAAIDVFNAALARNPDDPWALVGLRAATAGLGGPTRSLDARIRKAFVGDHTPRAQDL